MSHQVESMAARFKPWHFGETGKSGATVLSDGVMTAREAIRLGKLDWQVGLEELFLADGAKVEDRFAMVRDRDRKVLGTVGSRYVPFQNEDAFDFADALVASDEAKYESVGSLKGGKIVWLTMKVPQDILIAGEDRHELYILLRTSHDGSTAIGVYVTVVRVECMNTLTAALHGSSVKYRWAVPHVSTVAAKLQEAKDTLQMTSKYAEEFERVGNTLAEKRLSDKVFRRVLERSIPQRPKTEEVIETILTNRKKSATIPVDMRETAWGALNATTEYFDWMRPSRGGEAKLINVLDGSNARVRQRVMAQLTAI